MQTLEQHLENCELIVEQVGSRPDGWGSDYPQVHFKVTHPHNKRAIYYSVGIGHFIQQGLPKYEERLFTDLITQSDEKGRKKDGWMRLDAMKTQALGFDNGFKKALRGILRLENFEREERRGVYPESPKKVFVRPKLNKKGFFYSLTMDSSALYEDFEDWCMYLGYDDDSIKHKAIYEACCDNARWLTSLGFDLNELQEYYQDY